jgi:hypothetical protein
MYGSRRWWELLVNLAAVLLVETGFTVNGRPLLGIESAQAKARRRAIPKDASIAATANSRRIQAMFHAPELDRLNRILHIFWFVWT